MEKLGKVINQVTKFVQNGCHSPLGSRFMNLCPVMKCGSRIGSDSLGPWRLESIYCCTNFIPTAVKVQVLLPGSITRG